jgi:hypothetical protein
MCASTAEMESITYAGGHNSQINRLRLSAFRLRAFGQVQRLWWLSPIHDFLFTWLPAETVSKSLIIDHTSGLADWLFLCKILWYLPVSGS